MLTWEEYVQGVALVGGGILCGTASLFAGAAWLMVQLGRAELRRGR